MNKIELLSSKHKEERLNFTCGSPLLDAYFHRQVSQDVKKKLASCFVLTNEENQILGYYTLTNCALDKSILPQSIQKQCPYSEVPATLLGRLAISQSEQKKGYGGVLLIDALKKAYETSIIVASMLMVLDPISEEAISFYKNYEFVHLKDTGGKYGRMIFSMKSAKKLLLKMKLI